MHDKTLLLCSALAASVTLMMCEPAYSVAVPFQGSILLGAPAATSIQFNILSPTQEGTAFIEYGDKPGIYASQSASVALAAGKPLAISLSGLATDTQYYYRLRLVTQSDARVSEEYRFHTARSPGAAYTFTIQADSHLDENSSLEVYRQTLDNIRADHPDFHIDLGDTFMQEKHNEPLDAASPPATDQAQVNTRYAYERENFGRVSHSSPLFLVNGNHEGEAGWFTSEDGQNIAVWTTRARQSYFLNPVPNGFYSGDDTAEPFVGLRASWYAWQWGDALFVVLDPYWNTLSKSKKDPWQLTLGERQYHWLEKTLSDSPARFKFVFIHSLIGGLDGQMRGGVEAAPYYEWGGLNEDGSSGFAQKRPGWTNPIHPLLVRYGVTAVFHGHDHLYAKQELDGVIYQEVPQPSAKNFSSGPNLAETYHYTSGTILSSSGHIRVQVSPEQVTASYVKSSQNAPIEDTWTRTAVSTPSKPYTTPIASFAYTPETWASGQAVQFKDTSSGDPTTWLWHFGDGSTSTHPNPTHVYTLPGVFEVSLESGTLAGSTVYNRTATVLDKTAPLITSFDVPQWFNGTRVPVRIGADDNDAVAEYALTARPSAPLPNQNEWSVTPPDHFDMGKNTLITLYAWAKDRAGNRSAPAVAVVTLDRQIPVIGRLSVPARVSGLAIPITAWIARDNRQVAAYFISETATPPDLSAPGWTATPPLQYRVTQPGSHTLYAWVKDEAGNLSRVKTARCTVNLPQ
ncbi:MAG: PKD domain-containing protein [Methylococcaceae bacterium]